MAILSDIESSIQSWIDDQPYKTICLECGGSLEVDTTTDNDLDLILTITPCETCLDSARGTAEADTAAPLEKEIEDLKQQVTDLTAEADSRQ